MQADLNAVGCITGAVDGVIGPETLAALEAFQRAAGLSVDGDYGPQTKSKLTADASAKKKVCSTPATPQAASGGAPCTLQAIQAAVSDYQVVVYGCQGNWAYARQAGSVPGPGRLLEVAGSAWRNVPCPAPTPTPEYPAGGPPPGSGIPFPIYNSACIAI
ncbi:MAG: hypothetical protein DCC49_13065 [Acidobacteria bacterium]|nr:MAG: hypothetical protein DCC49_13065 [Acidobacteriota bacterium]